MANKPAASAAGQLRERTDMGARLRINDLHVSALIHVGIVKINKGGLRKQEERCAQERGERDGFLSQSA